MLTLKQLADILAEQIDYLRIQLARTGGPLHAAPVSPLNRSLPAEPQSYDDVEGISEIEEDLHAMRDAGLLDAEDLRAALNNLGHEGYEATD